MKSDESSNSRPSAVARSAFEDTDRANSPALLEVENLSINFSLRNDDVRAVTQVSFTVEAGETLVILGESGSGKSITAMAMMGLLPSPPAKVVSGHVRLAGVDLLALSPRALRGYRGAKIAMIFQDALSALNPVLSVGYQISEIVREHKKLSRSVAKLEAIELMVRVGIPAASRRYADYPHQFSGGMRQRVMIAMAIALNPALLIADEPTTALDVTIQAQIMALLAELRLDNHMGLILITHDLGVAAEVADRIVVMYAGRVVETASGVDLFRAPAHPYSAGLLASTPTTGDKGRLLKPIKGTPPGLAEVPSGCPFRTRCAYARERCVDEEPELLVVAPGRSSACHYWTEVINVSE